MSSSFYFDHAATTPLDERVFAVMRPHLTSHFANPSSLYRIARKEKQTLEAARGRVAQALGAKPTEIIWTSGGTESINMAIQGVLRAHPGAHWVTDAIEHDAVLALREPMERQGHAVTIIELGMSGIVRVQDIVAAIRPDTVLVSLMLANNEIGTIQPVMELAAEIKRIRAERTNAGNDLPLYLHTDACQTAGYLDLSVARLKVDLLTLNGSKIYGPKGSGILYVRYGTTSEPLIYGGGQERGRRSGTEDVAAAVGFAAAFELAQQHRTETVQRERSLRDELLERLRGVAPDLIVNGEMQRRLPNNLNICLPGVDGETLIMYLDEAGVLASTGSACSSSNEEPSHVLLAIGRTPEEASGSLRLTLGRTTDQAAIDHVVAVLPGIVARLRTFGA